MALRKVASEGTIFFGRGGPSIVRNGPGADVLPTSVVQVLWLRSRFSECFKGREPCARNPGHRRKGPVQCSWVMSETELDWFSLS